MMEPFTDSQLIFIALLNYADRLLLDARSRKFAGPGYKETRAALRQYAVRCSTLAEAYRGEAGK